MQFYYDSSLYFSVLPHDFVVGHFVRFCFDYKYLRRYLKFMGSETSNRIAFDSDGNLIESNSDAKEILVYNYKNGVFLRYIGTSMNHTHPEACTVDKTGRVYVIDTYCINIFRADGSYESTIDVGRQPICLAVDDNKLYMGTLHGLQIFNTITHCEIGRFVEGTMIIAVAIIYSTKQVVALSNCLLIFDNDITLIHMIDVQIDWASQLAVDIHNNIYVSHFIKDEISVFTNNGQRLRNFPHPPSSPYGIAISHTSILAVSDNHGIHFYQ